MGTLASRVDNEWTPPRTTIGARLGRHLLRLARKLPFRLRRSIESLVLRVSVLRGRRLVPEKALETKLVEALERLRASGQPIGDYLEFGVYNGTSLACMYRAARQTNTRSMRFIGFDSFEGLKPEAQDNALWEPGKFCCPRPVTEWYLKREKVDLDRVELVEGWFQDSLNPETARRLGLQKVSIIMIDCDVYSAAKRALDFSAPFIKNQCIILFDDWHSLELAEKEQGEKRAFDEFLSAHPELVATPLASYHDFSETFLVELSPARAPRARAYQPKMYARDRGLACALIGVAEACLEGLMQPSLQAAAMLV